MPQHPRRQPLNAGFTLVELALAMAIGGVIALVSALLFKAGMLSYLYAYKQGKALTAARAAFSGDGSKSGLLWDAQEASAVQTLHASTLTLTVPMTGTVSFYVSGNSFYRVAGSTVTVLAKDVGSLTLNYYNLNSSGLIITSTAAASATLVTARLTVNKSAVSDKDRVFFAGARLRNHP